MTYQIAVCDDQQESLEYISALVQSWAEQLGISVRLSCFQSGESFLFTYAEQKNFDILLLDIEMNAINGVELAKTIRKENDGAQIIFITGFPDYIAEGYEVAALHYLMKPVSSEKLQQVLNRALGKIKKEKKFLCFSANGETVRIAADEILFVEAFAHSCTITTENGRIEVNASITAVEKNLLETSSQDFIRCHRSYIVGVKFIKSIGKAELTLDNGTKIPLSRGKYAPVNQAFIRYFKGESSWDS